jgi:energy-coupling factor transporter transmembrane protein EcfT
VSDALDELRDPRKLHVRVGLAFVRTLRPALYALLVASALLTFWAGGRSIGGRELPRWAAQAAPILFAIFLVVFAVYRLALVRAKKYPAATGLFQIGLGALVWVLLLPGSREHIEHAQADDVQELLEAADPRVRALAAEVAGVRGDAPRYARQLINRLDDPDAHVREVARAALVRFAGGADAAPGQTGSDAQARWTAYAREHGWE